MRRWREIDETYTRELEEGRELLLSGKYAPGLLDALRRRMQTITRNMYVIQWIPEQREDLYDVLVDVTLIARVEVRRDGTHVDTELETWPLKEYLREGHLGKRERRRLAIAVRLAVSHL